MPAAIGPVTLIVIGAAGAVLRWTLAALDPPVAVVVLLQLLHGASFGATHLGTMMFLSRNAPEGGRAAAQGDIATANSLMMAAASALAGVLYGMSGEPRLCGDGGDGRRGRRVARCWRAALPAHRRS